MAEVQTGRGQKLDDDDEGNKNMGNYSQLCDLPDAVLQQILLLLPTKDAIRMCMSSKGWGSWWRSVPKLEFDEKQFRDMKIFKDFVQRTLRLRERDSPIEAFSLSCQVRWDFSLAPDIKEWIAFALNHNVRDLHLSLDYFHVLPSGIFRNETLRKLYLGGTYSNHILNIPRQVHFPSLKDLTLEGFKLNDDESVRNLLSCPSLEKLRMDYCDWRPVEAITVPAPLLHTFSTRCLTEQDSYLFYRFDMGSEIVIQAPSLKHFCYEGELTRTKFIIQGSPLLAEAELWIYTTISLNGAFMSKPLYELLHYVSGVKNLTLSIDLLKDLELQKDPFDEIPVFSNLIKLKFVEGRTNSVLKSFSLLLTRCPSLKTLQFNSKCYLVYSPLRHQDPLPSLFLPHLEKITIRCFARSSQELQALQTMLLDAPMLQEVVLHYKINVLVEEDQLDESFFNNLPKASKSCKFILDWC